MQNGTIDLTETRAAYEEALSSARLCAHQYIRTQDKGWLAQLKEWYKLAATFYCALREQGALGGPDEG